MSFPLDVEKKREYLTTNLAKGGSLSINFNKLWKLALITRKVVITSKVKQLWSTSFIPKALGNLKL